MKDTTLISMTRSAVAALLIVFAAVANATTYRLQKVTSVEDRGIYVFEQNGIRVRGVMNSNALDGSNSTKSTELKGSETYDFTLIASGNGFLLKTYEGKYVNNTSSTSVSLGTNAENATVWTIEFQESGYALIRNATTGMTERSLARKTPDGTTFGSHDDTGTNHPAEMTVYKLVDESIPVKQEAGLVYSTSTVTTGFRQTFTAPVLTTATDFDGTVSYTSTDESVATVNSTTGEVAIVGTGSTTIRATSAETDIFEAGSAGYTLNVTNGSGTADDPYTVGDMLSGFVATDNTDISVKGYVVGYYSSDGSAINTDKSNCSNLALADSRGETDITKTIPAELTSGLQASYSMASRPEVYGCTVQATGKFNTYYNKKGITSTSALSIVSCPVTVSSALFATLVPTEDLDFSGTALTAYTVSATDDYVVLTPIADGIAPKGQGVIIGAAEALTADIPCAGQAASTDDTGLETSNGTTAVGDDIYVLAKKDGAVGFGRWTSATSLSTGRVFLRHSTHNGQAAPPFLPIGEWMPAGINSITADRQQDRPTMSTAVFGTDGRRLSSLSTARGIVIVGGKKVVVR